MLGNNRFSDAFKDIYRWLTISCDSMFILSKILPSGCLKTLLFGLGQSNYRRYNFTYTHSKKKLLAFYVF